MKKILVIGSPGSGKSTFSKQLSNIINYPLLHIDRIFHIDNDNQITKDELRTKIEYFMKNNDYFIIDGNYSGTLEMRLAYADTIFYFDLEPAICLANVINRCKSGEIRDDIAPGFDNSIIDPEFIEYVKNFNERQKPRNDLILDKFTGKIIFFHNYKEVDKFFDNIKQFICF